MEKCFNVDDFIKIGLSVKELARLFGCGRVTLWRWRHGKEPPARVLEIQAALRKKLIKKGNPKAVLIRLRSFGLLFYLKP